MLKYIYEEWKNKGEANAKPLNATNLNKIEAGLATIFEEVACSDIKNLVVQKIHSSCEWIAPKACGNAFYVVCVGGGGGGGSYSYDSNVVLGAGGGGGGFISSKKILLEEGTSVEIMCGAGGLAGTDGGATSFDEHLSANGGKCGGSGVRDANNYKGTAGNGGDGSGAGGGGGTRRNASNYTVYNGNGGNGTYGGGGGGYTVKKVGSAVVANGTGGTGELGGNGGTVGATPSPGQLMNSPLINCLFDASLIREISLSPKESSGSGGIACNGGIRGRCSGYDGGAGGGGGFCGNGGDGGSYSPNTSSYSDDQYRYYGGGGGGGSYCGNGGTAGLCGGGGGGFFCNGGDAGRFVSGSNSGSFNGDYGGGGGGFFCDGSDGKTGNGGDGGVLIMYIRDTDEEEA